MNCVHNVNFASFAKKKSGKQGLQSVTTVVSLYLSDGTLSVTYAFFPRDT